MICWESVSYTHLDVYKRQVLSYREALAYSEQLDRVLLPYELAEGMKETKKVITSIRPGQSVGIYIGPEGGFEKEEVDQALEQYITQ